MQPTINPNKYLNETIELKTTLERTFILLAERLFNIFTDRLWEKSGRSSFEEFLLELKLDKTTASKLITVYRIYVIENKVGIPQLSMVKSWESLYRVRSLVTDKNKAFEMVENGAVLNDRDMRLLANPKEECKNHNFYLLRVCRDCNYKERVYNEE